MVDMPWGEPAWGHNWRERAKSWPTGREEDAMEKINRLEIDEGPDYVRQKKKKTQAQCRETTNYETVGRKC